MLVFLGTSACASDEPQGSATPCGGRAAVVTTGSTSVSEQGYRFELTALEPAVPVQSDGSPGNHWTVTVTDPSGAPVIGATLAVWTYMPDHAHSGPPAAGVERADGVYDVTDLVFPMPTLYSVTWRLTLASGESQAAALDLCLDVASG